MQEASQAATLLPRPFWLTLKKLNKGRSGNLLRVCFGALPASIRRARRAGTESLAVRQGDWTWGLEVTVRTSNKRLKAQSFSRAFSWVEALRYEAPNGPGPIWTSPLGSGRSQLAWCSQCGWAAPEEASGVAAGLVPIFKGGQNRKSLNAAWLIAILKIINENDCRFLGKCMGLLFWKRPKNY